MGLLKKHGHTALGIYQGIDTLAGEQKAAGFRDPISLPEIVKHSPHIIGFSAASTDFTDLLCMAEKAKNALPDTLIVFGGVHAIIMPESIMQSEIVDIVCVGEGEYPMLELADAIDCGKDYQHIKGLWVRKGNRVHRNPKNPPVQDLNSINFDREGLYYTSIFTGRGCVGNCTFCNAPTIRKELGPGKFLRKRSVENVLNEISDLLPSLKENFNMRRIEKLSLPLPKKYRQQFAHLIERFTNRFPLLCSPFRPLLRIFSENTFEIRFKDDTFLSNRNWFIEFAKEYSVRFPKISYVCQARAPEIDETVADLLKKSNCHTVSIGIECGNEEFRNKVLKKRVSNEEIRNAVALLKERNIRASGQWILGYPGETVDLALESLRFHMELGDIPQLHYATPFPKTEMHQKAVEMGLIEKEYIPNHSVYSDFLFHKGYERQLLRIIYNMFALARLKVDPFFEDARFQPRSLDLLDSYLGDILSNAIKSPESINS